VIKTTKMHLGLRGLCAAIAIVIYPLPTFAFDFAFPASASQTFQRAKTLGSFDVPIGPYRAGAMQTKSIEGSVSQVVWTVPIKDTTTLQLLAPLREQLAAAGYQALYDCDTTTCGGFDFRFGMDIAPEPDMHIDLGDFRYFAAERFGPAGASTIALVVSKSATLGFVQIVEIGPAKAGETPVQSTKPTVSDAAQPKPAVQSTSFGDALAAEGSVALDDLIFASGAGDLAPGDYASLAALAEYLRTNPDAKVALVGHTDASGSLAGNIALSRDRALSVRRWMIDNYDIPTEQIAAEGVGYLAPRDSNLTETGLTRNRRVEVMLLVNP
jgi:outer membrane protein OmpA-like peptidoglycan-associated protein